MNRLERRTTKEPTVVREVPPKSSGGANPKGILKANRPDVVVRRPQSIIVSLGARLGGTRRRRGQTDPEGDSARDEVQDVIRTVERQKTEYGR